MYSIPKPAHDAAEVYLSCARRVHAPDRAPYLRAAPEVDIACTEYAQHAAAGTLHEIAASATVGELSAVQMKKLYESKVVKPRAGSRPLYDELITSARHGICPFCVARDVSTLDHFLGKAHYPALAVAPANLIPCCSRCNTLKGETRVTRPDEQLIHPYFDVVEDVSWLRAVVEGTTPPAVRFRVDPPAIWTVDTSRRVQHQFDLMHLDQLYSSKAAGQMADIRLRLERLHAAKGHQGVSEHLSDEAESRMARNRNAWQAVTFQALAECEWYCDGGFALI